MILYALILCLGVFLVIKLGIDLVWEEMTFSVPLVPKKPNFNKWTVGMVILFFSMVIYLLID